MKTSFLFVCLVLSYVFCALAQEPNYFGYSNGSPVCVTGPAGVNIRSSPNGQVIGKLNRGDTAVITSSRGTVSGAHDWWQVRAGNLVGWGAAGYIGVPLSAMRGSCNQNNIVSPCEWARSVRSAGFPESVVSKIVCTAMKESGLRRTSANALNPGPHWGSIDWGIMQINDKWWCGRNSAGGSCGIRCSDFFVNIDAAARCAKRIYDQQGLNAWHAYTSNRWECDSYRLSC